MIDRSPVLHRATQSFGWRGVLLELAAVPGVGAAFWFLGFPRDTVVLVMLGMLWFGVMLLHLPARRGVVLTSQEIRWRRSSIPLGDITEVVVTERRRLRAILATDEAVTIAQRSPGARGAVIVRARSPEGSLYGVAVTVDDAPALGAAIELARRTAIRPRVGISGWPLPLRRRHGVDQRTVMSLMVPLTFAELATFSANGSSGFVLLVAAWITYTGARRIVIDEAGVRSGRHRIPWEEIESIRSAPRAEVRSMRTYRSQLPIWSSAHALVIVRRRGTRWLDGDRLSRTLIVACPVAVDLTGAPEPDPIHSCE